MLTLSEDAVPHLGRQALLRWQQELLGARGYLEFGGGGSTVAAHKLVSGPIVSIESDPDFVEAIHDVPLVRQAVLAGRSFVLHGDVGPVREWGYPVTLDRDTWYNYALKPLLTVPKEILDVIDVVMVDGRFRVACALVAWSLCPNLRMVVVDDWEREPYRDLVSILDVLEVAMDEGASKETAFLVPSPHRPPGSLSHLPHVFLAAG